MIKKILIGSGIALGVVGVITGTVVGVVVSNKKNNTNSQVKPEDNKPNVPTDKPTTPEKPENKPDVPTTPEKPENKPDVPTTPEKPEKPSAEQIAFMNELNASAFVRPVICNSKINIKLSPNTNQTNVSIETIEQETIEQLKNIWFKSGTIPPIEIKKNGSEYVISLDKTNQNIDKYTSSIFGQTWSGIIKNSTNNDFKNINKVDYGFKLIVANDKSNVQLVPTFTKVFFAQQPSWLKETSFITSLLENVGLISKFELSFH